MLAWARISGGRFCAGDWIGLPLIFCQAPSNGESSESRDARRWRSHWSFIEHHLSNCIPLTVCDYLSTFDRRAHPVVEAALEVSQRFWKLNERMYTWGAGSVSAGPEKIS